LPGFYEISMKRIFLLVATNVAILLVLSVTLRVFGVDRILDEQGAGLDLTSLLIFSAVLGFSGSLISLAMSKFIAKRMMGVRVIEQPRDANEAWLVETVRRQAAAAGIGMPEVGIFDAPDMNAFATGPRKNNALVAVSTGLLRGMSRQEAEAVLGHEVSHVANGDMVTLTLIQGVVNTFVVFLARVVGYMIDKAVFRNNDDRGPGMGYMATVFVCEIVFGILASMIVAWFSRYREFRADAGSAKLLGTPQPMVKALARLGGLEPPESMPQAFKSFGINGGTSGLMALFASHPPIEQRIAALRGTA
jgi:heat shock protein HtpX